ncbi:hypothetical protein A5N15_02915 [Rothia kristinae]|uniref:Uncharacterized protein n=1 Tax=Rothia kristinae TaxID=37923 RepID=A0A657IVN9_9MICC|nr:hypothetical protein A5N15_02915 [Rothia kristinae]
MQHAVTADDARAQLVSALPTAGLDGTLAARFEAADEAAGRGYVRAKTGTLLKVSSLSGSPPPRTGACWSTPSWSTTSRTSPPPRTCWTAPPPR